MTASSWLFGSGRLRPGWRILLYLLLLLVFFVAGQYAVSVLPSTALGWVNYLVLTAAGLMAGWVVLVRLDGSPPGALGFALNRAAPREVLHGLALGAGLITTAALLIFISGAAVFVPDGGTLPLYLRSLVVAFAYFWLAAAYEEVWFRGYAFQALVEGVGPWPTVLGTSVLFSLMHGGNPEVGAVAFVNIFLAGILLALAYLRTRSLWFATAVHAGWNWAMASPLAFPVSGLNLVDTPLYDAREVGADWWTGGAFGPEAGLAGTLVILLGIAAVVKVPAFRESPEMRALRPIVDRRLRRDEP